jgi:hypothetical protein
VATRRLSEHLLSLDPDGTTAFAVSRAGEAESRRWFDASRALQLTAIVG